MPSGQGMLNLARQHIGERYENVLVPKNNPNWHGPWDCAEFMSWLVYQEAQILYGCTNDNDPPAIADAYTGNWKLDSDRLGIRVPVETAAGTVGGMVLRYPPSSNEMGHIAICDGQGGTIEAKGHAYGVVADTVQNRSWDTGVLIPSISYDPSNQIRWIRPSQLYAWDSPNMSAEKVTEIQKALLTRGFDPGPIDGIFGLNTATAVAAFQQSAGLVTDGDVGPQTANALGISLTTG